jgi:hypothetical protein
MFPYSLFKSSAQLILPLMCWLGVSVGQSLSREEFPSAEKASGALFAAVQSDDEQAIARVVGGDKDLVSSGDSLADHQDREVFLEKYRQMHRLVQEPDGTTELYIGAENWPFPIPLVAKNGGWFFDSDAGGQEVRFRRIGENEEYVLETCEALFAGEQPPSGISHGYYVRQLRVKGSGGKAGDAIFIAYPADYRSSGVMTFVVAANNGVFKKDLGPETANIAKTMSSVKVDRSWQRAE